jgi:hypothetical protein
MKRKRILSNLLCASLLFTFLIGTHEGRLSIWKDGDPTPAKVLPVPTALLPPRYRAFFARVSGWNPTKRWLDCWKRLLPDSVNFLLILRQKKSTIMSRKNERSDPVYG